MQTHAKVIVPIQANHGEGPIWDPFYSRVFWVDLVGRQIFSYKPDSGTVTTRTFSEPVCAVDPREDGRLLVAFAKRIAWVTWPDCVITEIVSVESTLTANRCNDGKRDPAGRFWIGTMSQDGSVVGAGALYRLDLDGALHPILRGLTIANGMGWSPDGRTMYFIDSPIRDIWAFSFDSRDSSISDQRVVVHVPEGLGLPDGMTVGDDGSLWVAHWGAGCVCQWDPQTGQRLATVYTDCPHTSSCAFGGTHNRDLYITTSRMGLKSDTLMHAPMSGSLFKYSIPAKK